jgi:hypothetical protein
MSQQALEDLRDSIEQKLVTSGEKEFIPEASLVQLINPQVVRSILEDDATEDLIEFFSEKAFKVFAILAMNDGSKDLFRHMYEKRFQDDMLPVRKHWSSDEGSRLELHSCTEGADNESVKAAFRYGNGSPWGRRPDKIKSFSESWQWPYTTPVFVEDNFRYKFPDGMRLPFTKRREKKTGNSHSSLYSYVEEKSIHVDHIPRNLVRVSILVNLRGPHRY